MCFHCAPNRDANNGDLKQLIGLMPRNCQTRSNTEEKKMVRAILATILVSTFILTLSSSVAHATGGVYCTGQDNPGVTIGVSMGRLPILAVLSGQASDGKRTYATQPEGDDVPIAFGQGMIEPERVAIDFTDPNIERVLISLRIFTNDSGHDDQRGELTFGESEAIAVTCEFE